jgi:Fic family protein
MALTCEKLMEFNLVEDVEKSFNTDLVIKFISTLNDIETIDKFIKDSPAFPGSTDKIMRNELVSIVGATLSIEGTVLDKDEIEESFKKAKGGEHLRRKEQEAENSRKVYIFIKDFVKRHKDGFAYSESLIKQIHSCFTCNMNYLSNVPGQYRSNFIATFGYPRKESLCRTGTEIEEAMGKFVNWLNKKEDGLLSRNIFVKAIMAHYYLSEIHPFGDGNGRTARALEALILYAHGVNEYCFWSLANFWSAHKDQYLSNLHDIRVTLNPTDFIIWGLDGYKDELTIIKGKVLKKVKQLMLSDYVHYLFRNKKHEKVKINHRIVDIVQLLISQGRIPINKFMSSPEVIALYRNASSSTRVRDFQKMAERDLIKIEKIENETFIEPNFQLLERLTYNV